MVAAQDRFDFAHFGDHAAVFEGFKGVDAGRGHGNEE
jgi:hypothetical protein